MKIPRVGNAVKRRAFLAFAMLALLAGCGEPLPADKRDYAGDWQGVNMRLYIGSDGTVSYTRVRGASRTSINAGIQRFEGANFFVGVGPFATRFEVSKPPHRVGNAWKMTVDGVELTRVAGGAGDDRSA
ncbi:MAG TPA: hypothetical protein VHP55_00415 [Usitatibacter sp.]|nr:hypothetical protein [Usitatibacter sp.]